jgi:hypothetical protein
MLCWLNQRLISRRVDDGEGLSPRLREHVAGCESCRNHFEEQRRVAALLSLHAAEVGRELPPFLHGRIMAAVRSREAVAGSLPSLPRWAAGLAAALALAVTWFAINHRDQPEAAHQRALAGSFAASGPAPERLMFQSVPRVDLVDLSMRLEQPFADEAGAVAADARSAMRLLAQNFVPAEWNKGMRLGGGE